MLFVGAIQTTCNSAIQTVAVVAYGYINYLVKPTSLNSFITQYTTLHDR